MDQLPRAQRPQQELPSGRPARSGRPTHALHYDLINILYQNPDAVGKTLANTSGPFYAGGYQCDLGPETVPLPRRLQLSVGKHPWRSPRHYTVETASPVEAGVPVRIMKSFTMDHDTGELGIRQRLANASEAPVAFSLRDRTVCKGGGFAFFKLNPQSRFPNGCSILRQSGSRLFYQAVDALPENVTKAGDRLIIDTRQGAAKLAADITTGWVAYVRGNLLFVKYFPIIVGGDYPDNGTALSLNFPRKAPASSSNPVPPTTSLNAGSSSRWSGKSKASAMSVGFSTRCRPIPFSSQQARAADL